MAVVKELLRYLREHRKCSRPQQVAELKKMRKTIASAATEKVDLTLTV